MGSLLNDDDHRRLLLPCGEEEKSYGTLPAPNDDPKVVVYARRWYYLAVFSFTCFTYGMHASVFSPVAHSFEQAYGWTNADVATVLNWPNLVYLGMFLPFAWILESRGLRAACLLGVSFLVLGSGLRCVYITPAACYWTMQFGQALIGPTSCIVFAAPSCMSATWFPAHQRTTATAASAISMALGGATSFVLGPLLVPVHVNATTGNDSVPSTDGLDDIRRSISLLLYVNFALAAVAFILVVVHFPARPPYPPSASAAVIRTDFRQALPALLQNRRFLTLGFIFSLTNGVAFSFMGLLDVDLKAAHVPNDQAVTGSLIIAAVFGTCIFSLVIATVADRWSRYIKAILLSLYVGGAVMFLWFALVVQGLVVSNLGSLYVSFVVGTIFMNASLPLFYELACDSCYPTPETLANGILNAMSSLASMAFLGILMAPGVGTAWMNWSMVGACLVCVPILVPYKQRYGRLTIDTQTLGASNDDITA